MTPVAEPFCELHVIMSLVAPVNQFHDRDKFAYFSFDQRHWWRQLLFQFQTAARNFRERSPNREFDARLGAALPLFVPIAAATANSAVECICHTKYISMMKRRNLLFGVHGGNGNRTERLFEHGRWSCLCFVSGAVAVVCRETFRLRMMQRHLRLILVVNRDESNQFT
jgi:hypothetical protein